MPTIRHSSLLLGTDLEIILDEAELAVGGPDVSVSIALLTDEGDVVAAQTFERARELRFSTVELQPGFYDLEITSEDDSIRGIEPIMLAAPEFGARLDAFQEALGTYASTKSDDGPVLVSKLRRVADIYRSIGLDGLAKEVDQERLPFDTSHRSALGLFRGTGRRKAAVVRAWLRPGDGLITVIGGPGRIEYREYFSSPNHYAAIRRPLETVRLRDTMNVVLNCSGGGKSGQAEAARLAISRALLQLNPEFRSLLKPLGYLRTDSRIRERKKPGQKGARKKFQFSKR